MSSLDIFPSGIKNFIIFYSVVMTMPNDQCLTDYAESVLFLLVPGMKINECEMISFLQLLKSVSLLCSGLRSGMFCTHFS